MSANWNISPLSELTHKITKGTTPSKKDGGFSDDGINYIKAESVGFDGRIDESKFSFISEGVHEKFKRSQLEENDILFSMAGVHLGKTALVEKRHVPANTNQALALIRPNTAVIYPKFLLYFLQKREVVHFANNATSQSAQPNINLKDIGSIEVCYPDLEEQIRIANKIDCLNQKIELNRQTNQTLESISQAIFKSWFLDFEPTRTKIRAKENGKNPELAAMAAIAGKEVDELESLSADQLENLKATAALFPDRFVESELGQIPEGWDVKALDEIAHYQNGLALQKFRPEDENHFLPVLKIAQLKKGFADGAEKASPNIKEECIVNDGDVVFSWSGSLMIDVWCGGNAALNQHLFKVTSEQYPKWFYYYWTKQHLESFQQIAADKAVTMGHIKRSHLAEAKCAVPNVDMNSFQQISLLLDKIVEQRLESTTLEQVRDALLPKLLSGELEVGSAN